MLDAHSAQHASAMGSIRRRSFGDWQGRRSSSICNQARLGVPISGLTWANHFANHSYAAALRKLGFSFSSPEHDSIIERLDTISAVAIALPQLSQTSQSFPSYQSSDPPPLQQFSLSDVTFSLPESHTVMAMSDVYTPAQANLADPFLNLWPW